MLGDVAIAAETVSNEANAAGLAAEDHLLHLFTHGVLHLLGYDHIDDDMAAEMEAFEIELLASMNIANPYDLHQRIAMLEGNQ
jgi:probable rRNA maturation factor